MPWKGFWQWHLDLWGNPTSTWCYCFGICSSVSNSEPGCCSEVFRVSDLVKVIVNGYCRFTLLLSQEGMDAGSQIWKLVMSTQDRKEGLWHIDGCRWQKWYLLPWTVKFIYIKKNANFEERWEALTGNALEQISARKSGWRKQLQWKCFICFDQGAKW